MPETKTGLPTDEELRFMAQRLQHCESSFLDPYYEALREVRDRTERATKARTLRWAAEKVLANGLLPMDTARIVAAELREAAREAERA